MGRRLLEPPLRMIVVADLLLIVATAAWLSWRVPEPGDMMTMWSIMVLVLVLAMQLIAAALLPESRWTRWRRPGTAAQHEDR